MKLARHKIKDIPFERARWTGGAITPEIVVIHDTASRLDEGSAARYLLDNDAKVSVHFVIERGGIVVQQVPTNRRANHAGKSHYHGRDGVNSFSIGIELVNPGKMRAAGSQAAVAWYGETFVEDEVDDSGCFVHLQDATTPEHGTGVWMDYTQHQIAALIELLQALFSGIDTLTDIRTHWYVSPGRKVDTNPLFPLEHIRSLILGRDDPAEDVARVLSSPPGRDRMVAIETPGDSLNMRRWPSFNPNVITAIPDQAIVPVLRSGIFAGREWHLVFYGGQEGWIVSRYTADIEYAQQGNAA